MAKSTNTEQPEAPANETPTGAESMDSIGKSAVIVGEPQPTHPSEVTPAEESEAERILGAKEATLSLRQHWTDADGKAHSPGDKVTVDASTALTLIGTRWATRTDVGDKESAED